ncbi:MAG TPA: hypothetical protein VKV25_05125, partial [Acidimicrobiales bacterium]|nr:hypothetical protein [Acidimicrobiales bacterium]
WVAESLPLARGWERQTDMADDPLFYRPGALDARSYRHWLLADGVRYVALPAAPIDFAGTTEARLLRAGVPGLRPVWRGHDWRVWRVVGSRGLAGPGATVLSVEVDSVTVRVHRPGAVVLRVRWNGDWRVRTGVGCVSPSAGGWTTLRVRRAGTVRLAVGLSGRGACGAH